MASVTESLKDREIVRLRADAIRTRERFTNLCAIVSRLTARVDRGALLSNLARAACEVTKAEFGAVTLFEESGRVIDFVTHGVPAETVERIGGPPQGLGILGWIREQPRTARLSDLTQHPRSVGFPEHHPTMGPFLGAPLHSSSSGPSSAQAFGALIATRSAGAPEFTEEDQGLFELLASHAVSALTYAPASTALTAMDAPLREGQEHFSRLFYDSPVAIAITRLADDTLVDVNDAFIRLTGHDRDQLVGHPVEALGLRLKPDQCARVVQALKKTGSIHDWDMALRHASGRVVNVRLAADIMVFGGEEHVVAFMEDLTGQREAAADRERLAAIVDSSDDAIFSYTPDGCIMTWNEGARRMFGYSPEEAIGANLSELLKALPELPATRGLLEDSLVSRTETELVRKDGEPVLVALTSSRVLDKTGEIVAVSGIARDITAHKQAERATDIERERLKTIIDTSPAGIFVVDAASEQVLMFNREFERVNGLEYHIGQPLGAYQDLLAFRRPDGTVYETEELPIRRAMRRGERVQAEEVLIQRPDGTTVPTVMSATPIYDLDGHIVSGVLIIDDITPLEEVERLRNDFLGLVSHELRSPLAIIKTAVEWARDPEDGERDQQAWAESMQAIGNQTDRLLGMVDNLLDMTQIEAGVFNVIARPSDLAPVLDYIENKSRHRGGSPLLLDVPARLPQVNMDRRRVQQVLENLVSRAAAHARPGTPIRVTIRIERLQVVVSVHNQGPGIPPESVPYLFRKFSPAEDSARSIGVGLRLAICKGIVEAHGGRIWVDSSVDRGETTFNFTLPVAVEQADERPVAVTRRAQHVGRVRRTGERTRVLAVDDEPQMLRYLQRTLSSAGYHPIVSKDPARTIELLETEDPDLVLLDLLFPGSDGLKVLKEIRAVSGIPVLFLSAVEGDAVVQALQGGADDYITKPFSASELLARVEASLRRRVLPDQVEVRPPYRIDGLSIDFNDRRVTIDNKPVPLSATEYKLLFELAGNAGRVLTNQELLHRIWGPEYSSESHLLRSFVRNLRRKLHDDARHPQLIFTERGIGYRMRKD